MKIVVAGMGIGCITMIKEIRKFSYEPQIEVFTDESRPFYWRPRLIELLANESDLEKITPYNIDWYENNGVILHFSNPIVGIDTSSKKALSRSGLTVDYDAFVFANGAMPFVLPIPGKELSNVYTLRTFEDVEKIKSHYGKSKKFTIIGGGVLGIETASALKRAGEQDVTVVEFFPYLLPRQLDASGSAVLKFLIEKKYELKLLLGKTTSSIEGNESVEKIKFADGTSIDSDVVIFSAGVRPNVEIAKSSGITVEKGIVVDDAMQTNVEDVYAIGDVAQHQKRIYGIEPPAVEQAKVLGQILCSKSSKYHGSVPSAILKVAGIDLLSVGEIEPNNEKSIFSSFGDMIEGFYKKVVVSDGYFVGVITIGVKRPDALKMKKLVDEKVAPSNSIVEYVKTVSF